MKNLYFLFLLLFTLTFSILADNNSDQLRNEMLVFSQVNSQEFDREDFHRFVLWAKENYGLRREDWPREVQQESNRLFAILMRNSRNK